ncbi:MAG TPA: CotH kinase family protein, partial [Candidatus Paceibacterota bacterium]|nr:CotH kinase family protein [Candidatus Paceibacterota bacterium]
MKTLKLIHVLVCGCILGSSWIVQAGVLFPAHSSWRYYLGRSEASYPTDAWRTIDYGDFFWTTGTTPIGYGETNITTTIPTSSNRRWMSVFLRKTFNVSNPANLSELILSVWIDDGCAVWINGRPVGRYNVPEGELAYDTPSRTPLPLGSIEQTLTVFRITNDLSSILVPGQNLIAVQAFNVNRNNDDFLFDAAMEFVPDQKPPTVAGLIPPTGAKVPVLTHVEVTFDEGVKGVDAADLRLNGSPARSVMSLSDSQYIFEFDPPVPGEVQVSWIDTPGISDLANPPNPFAGGNWTYTLDPNVVSPDVVLSEFMADNDKGIHDEDGDDSDWIEIYNPGYGPVDLSGWKLMIHPGDSAAWVFPKISLLANRFLVVYASGKNRTSPAAPLHTNFKLDKGGSYLALVNPEDRVISEFAPAYPAQRTDVSYGRDRLDTNLLAFFTTPTPGAPNSIGGQGFASAVQFSVPSKTFTGSFELVLSTASSNAVIRYSIGTNLPSESSPLYEKPITLSGSTHLRARTFEPGLLPGPVHSETYLLLSSEVKSFSSDLPIMVLHNLGKGQVPGSVDQFVAVQLFEPRTGPSSMTNAPVLATAGIFHKRGRSTGGLPKASFFVEIQDELGDDKKVSIAGLPEESDWVLYAPNDFDPVLIHNPMAHELMRQMGRYSPRTRFVEVYLKDDSGSPGPITPADYNGIYVLTEKIKIDQNRIDIDKLQPEHSSMPKVSGGYLLSIDNAPPNTRPFSGAGAEINYLDPDYFEINTPQRNAQKNYLSDYFNAFNQALQGASWTDPVQGYAAFIDVAAAIDHHIQGVVTFNVDALRLSGYFYIPRNGKITMGPVWDFDRTQGSADGRDFNPRLWRSTVPDYGTDMFNSDPRIFTNPWYSRMFKDIDFWQKWIDRYQALRRGALKLSNIEATIDSLANEVRQAQPREVNRWRGSNGSDTSPRNGSRSSGGFTHVFPGTYQGEVDFMKLWYSNRLEFIDGQLLSAPVITPSGEFPSPGSTLTLAGPPGATIYYTLDGRDPRLPSGGVSPTAKTYDSPIPVTANLRLVARCQDLNHKNLTGSGNPPLSSPWSAPVEKTVVIQIPALVITEIMYHPPATSGDPTDPGEFEYIELRNTGTTELDLNGFRLSGGVSFVFSNLALTAGQSVLVVRNQAAFETRYGTNLLVAGVFDGQLDNAGERLVLEGPLGESILDFAYNNSWYPITDGHGFSLVIRDENAPPESWNLPPTWRPSSILGGSPARIDPPLPQFPMVVINEVLVNELGSDTRAE